MTPEDRALLEQTHKLSEENNKLLRAMRRSNRVVNIMRIGYWIIIILVSFGAYYFIQPYVNTLFGQTISDAPNGEAQSRVDLINSLLK